MKFIVTADLHLTDAQPANRIDNYKRTLLMKFHQICELGASVDGVIVAGDFFDRPTESYDLTREVLAIIQNTGARVYAIPGQHDLRYHSKGLANTPLGILMQANAVDWIDNIPISSKEAYIHGHGWEDALSTAILPGINILVTHEMVTATKEGLFPGHEGFQTKRGIFKKYPGFDVIISGDNHKPHLWEKNGKIQLNCGSICRKGKDQVNYRPSVWLFDTENLSIEEQTLFLLPPEKVFDFEKIEQEEVRQELKKYMEDFIDSLHIKTNTPNFKDNLSLVMKKAKVSLTVKGIINQIMEDIKC